LDRNPTAARVLIIRILALALAAVALAGAGSLDLTVIHAARWLAPGADRVVALGSIRTECLGPAHDPEQAYLIEVGRAAFRTPLLLGGQAARAGLACESCHQGGRSNPDFFFPGLSGAPGTADVTSSLFSTHRDDGLDNPKPIPDLSGAKDRLKVSQDPADPALRSFIHGLITEEFDGAEPPAQVLAGVAAYVRALSPAACPAQPRQALRAQDFVMNAQRAARAAGLALGRKDPTTAVFLVGAARTQLGLISERFDQPGSDRARAALRSADLDLQAARAAIRAGDSHAGERLAVWLAETPSWTREVEAQADQSLFNPARLAAAGAKP
jgi:hypothetical protein